MPTISLTLPVAGTGITAGLHSTNYSALQTLLNGGLDAANLAAGSVGISEISATGTPSTTTFLRGDNAWATVSAGPGAPSTTLPASPTNGQQAILTDSLTAPTYHWLLQYDTAITDAYKWRFIGGIDARATVATDETIGTSGVWKNLTTDGPSITVARAGIYRIEYHATVYSAGGVANDFQFGPAIGETTPTEFVRFNNPSTNADYVTMYGSHQLTTAALDIIKLRYVITGNTGSQFGHRYIMVTPVRVS